MRKRGSGLLISIMLLVILATAPRWLAAHPVSTNHPSEVTFPAILIAGNEAVITFYWRGEPPPVVTLRSGKTLLHTPIDQKESITNLTIIPETNQPVIAEFNETTLTSTNRAIPFWYGIIPPLLVILLVLIFKEVFSALLIGLLSGTWMISWYGGLGAITAVGAGLLRIVDTYIIQTLLNNNHISIIAFSMMIGGMVYVIIANGGMKGIIALITKVASSRRSTLLSTWIMGMVVFFDDYANTLVVGNTMRPLSDSKRISREKLSYVVDSTAAPVAAVAFITTWIGAELSYIQGALEVIAAGSTSPVNAMPYAIFLHSLPYAFYPFLTLGFVGMLIWSGRDYGPMYRAEIKALSGGEDVPLNQHESSPVGSEHEASSKAATRPRAFNAILPVATVIMGAFAGLLITGMEVVSWKPNLGFGANLMEIIGHADTFRALLWASFSGLFLAILLTVSQRILTLRKTIDQMNKGFRTMLGAVLILVLAWSLALITKNLQTAEFLSEAILRLELSPRWLPLITFLLAAATAFSTGSSWSTMAILYPLLLPSAWNLFHAWDMPYDIAMMLFHATVASVLAGSVMGDHCSPISDTTILSSLATQCDHVQHVKTQLPYALTTGSIAIVAGIIPVSFGLHPAIAMIIAFVIMAVTIRLAGRKTVVQHQKKTPCKHS